ncbi:MAG: ABC transporter permease [Ectothiorhodospiraceae bacterium]|nr:ABC transporter permease [Chromatiales bacterium]MCP5154498.1 ABC transporter permease [Ectothiorhodospiraceae bacterium]
MDAVVVSVILTVVTAATPLLFAALGELVVERAGVLNLGVEGMMLCGAIAGFAAATGTGSATVGIVSAALAGAALAMVFAVVALGLRANQVATGLALTLFGVGLSSLLGQGYVGFPYAGLPRLSVPILGDIPVIGPILLGHDALVYLSLGMTVAVAWFLGRTRAGLVLRAVGESHDAAHALGYPVLRIRVAALAFGGAMCGLGGAYLSLAYSPMWAQNMTAGRGWIALALVVFATWRPLRAALGAYLFGGVTILQLHAQSAGFALPSQFLSMLPYLATILVLVMISRDRVALRLHTPASLGRVFDPPG